MSVFDSDDYCCPKCNQKLVRGEDKEYETLDEHVFNVNEISPKRATYVCPSKCLGEETFWGIDGDLYTDHYINIRIFPGGGAARGSTWHKINERGK